MAAQTLASQVGPLSFSWFLSSSKAREYSKTVRNSYSYIIFFSNTLVYRLLTSNNQSQPITSANMSLVSNLATTLSNSVILETVANDQAYVCSCR